MRTALDPRPLPWLVAVGFNEQSELGQALRRRGGTVAFVDAIHEVRQEDYHFVVSEGSVRGPVAEHISVLQFIADRRSKPGSPPRSKLADYRSGSIEIFVGDGSRAERFEVGPGGEARGIQQLIRETIIGKVPVGGDYSALYPHTQYDTAKLESLVREVDGEHLGAVRTTQDGWAEWWILPSVTTNRESWLKAAFAAWKAKNPEKFPPDGFGGVERWMTHDELRAVAAVAAHQSETSTYLHRRMKELSGLKAEVEVQTSKANSAHRRLLAAQGDALVEAVTEALRCLGFRVTDSDEEAAANKAAKREDLQLESDVDSGWIALLEVKGYSNRSAKTNDIAQLGRAVGFFEHRTGKIPSAQWYVVNAKFELPPDERPVPLESSPEDVDDFARDGGLVVDTRELFLLLRQVEDKTISPKEAQRLLVQATGTFSSPVPLSAATAEAP